MSSEAADRASNEAFVAIANGPLVGPVLGRVVGILAARAEFPIDRLDDALLIADAVAAKAGLFAANGRVHVHVLARLGEVELVIGPLVEGGADELVASAALPGVGNVIERVADEIESRRSSADGGGADYLRIKLGFSHAAPTYDPVIGA